MQRAALIATLVLLVGCGTATEDPSGAGRSPRESAVVAVVGGEPIYARDFVLNYEFGFPHLRGGDDPRLTYLQHVIDEKLLAFEGYRRGFHESEGIRQRLESLREELLVEQVFERYVNDSVIVTDEDIRSAMQSDAVSFKLLFVPASTFEDAQQLRERAARFGFDRIVSEFAAAQRDTPVRREDLESPYVTRHDINPMLLDAVAELPVGAISQPVRYHGSYLLIQVLDIRRDAVGPASSAKVRSQYEQVVFQQKARAKAHAFIGSMMTPLDVRVKPEAYVTLRDNLWRWYQDVPPEGNLLHALEQADSEYAAAIRSVLDDVLISTTDGDWTARAFLQEFPVERYPLRTDRTESFEGDLYDAIGLTLRDDYFVRRAEEEGLGENAEVEHGLDLWSDKWVFRAFAESIQKEGGSVRDTLRALREEVAVEINHNVLDTLTLSDPQSPQAMLLKGHTMRPAIPVADAAW